MSVEKVSVVVGMALAAGIAGIAYSIGVASSPSHNSKADDNDIKDKEEIIREATQLVRDRAISDLGVPRMSDCHDAICPSNDILNVRVRDIKSCISPTVLSEETYLTDVAHDTIVEGRKCVQNVLHDKDDRLIVIVGPCSIHDTQAAMEYARKLQRAKEQHAKDLLIVMRVYFEKPRTTVGWKGLINDPYLNGTYNINKGLRIARQLLVDINSLGLPCGTEFLDAISPQYTADLITWGAIGARTTESQVHRELASGLSMPIGFKNATNGDLQVAVDAVNASRFPHCFLSVSSQGQVSIVTTEGNEDSHIILRGGAGHTNYDKGSIENAVALLSKSKVLTKLVVDCSHGNSKKIHTNQPIVSADLAQQIAAGNRSICGVMIESNLVEGAQKEPLKNGGKPLEYGMSITDACVDWATTETMLEELAEAVRTRRGAA